MITKLTLTIEKSVIEKAKKYAKEKERSLSDIIGDYLKALTENQKDEDIKITPLVKSLKGSFKAPKDFEYKRELTKSLEAKYLKK